MRFIMQMCLCLICAMPAVAVPISASQPGNSRRTVSAISASTMSRTSGAVRIRRLSV